MSVPKWREDKMLQYQKFRNSIALRYFLAIVAVLIIGQLVFSTIVIYTNFAQQQEDLHKRAVAHVIFLSEVIPDNILANNFYPIETLMQRTAAESDFVYSLVTNVDGQIITNYLEGDDPLVQDALKFAEEPNTLSRVNYLSQLNGIIEVESPVIADGLLISHVRLGYTTESLYVRLRNNVITTLILSAILSASLALVSILLFNIQIRNPLNELSNVATQLARGNLDKRSVAQGNTEISQLQYAFNEMASQIQASIDELDKLSQVASRTKNAVIICDPLGRIEWINQAFIEITGYTLEEVKCKTPGSLLQGENSDPETINYMRDHIRRGEGFDAEIINYHKSGKPYWIAIEVRPAYDQDGKLKNFIAIETDITERKVAEQRIRESEALKSGILETALDAIISIDHNSNIIEFNSSAEQIFGYTHDDVIGKQLSDVIVPTHLREAHIKGLNRYINTHEAHVLGQRIEMPALRSDGTEFPVELAITALEYNDAPIFTAHLRDITERKQAEEKIQQYAQDLQVTNADLKQQEERLRSLILIATKTTETQQQLDLVVEQGAKALRLSVGIICDLVGEELEIRAVYAPAMDIQHHTRLKLINTIEATLVENREIFSSSNLEEYDAQLTSALPLITKSYIGISVRVNGTAKGILSFVSDKPRDSFTGSDYDFLQMMARWVSVTIERQEARDELSAYADELERSNRELQNFAYVSSHDLQEPLRKIQAFGSRIESRYADVLDERGIDYLQRIQNAAHRMQDLINDLLAFSRVTNQEKAFREVDLNKSLAGVLSDLEIRINETHTSIHRDELPIIDAEPLHMRQLFQNIISNAIKFQHTDRHPEIFIRSTIKQKNRRDMVEVQIIDNGIGFDEKYADKIFTIFQRLHTRQDYEGTGIGLAICRRIVEHHQGTIQATSQENVGTTFTICLPIKQMS